MTETNEESPPTDGIVESETALAEQYASRSRSSYTAEVATNLASALEGLDGSVDVVLLERGRPDGRDDDVLSTIQACGLACRVAVVTGVDPGPAIVDVPFDEYRRNPVSTADRLDTTRLVLARDGYREVVDELHAITTTQVLRGTSCSRAVQSSSEECAALEVRTLDRRAHLIASRSRSAGRRSRPNASGGTDALRSRSWRDDDRSGATDPTRRSRTATAAGVSTAPAPAATVSLG